MLVAAVDTAQTAYHAADIARERVQQQHQADADIVDHIATLTQKRTMEQTTVETLQQQIVAGQRFLQAQSQLHTKPLQDALHDTTVQLFEVGKTSDELIPVFRLRYRNVPWSSLSFSEKLRCAVELAHAVTVLTDVAYPLFLDNAESVGHWMSPAHQTIWAYFVPDTPTLTWTTDGMVPAAVVTA